MFAITNKAGNNIGNRRYVVFFLLILLMLSIFVVPVEAHMPGASETPEFELDDITIFDGGEEIEISMDDVGDYHNKKAKEQKMKMLKNEGKTDAEIDTIIEKDFEDVDGKCPCTTLSFRVMLLAISEIWGDNPPQRDDIKIISALPTAGACQVFQYITGTAKDIPDITSKGELCIILPNGTDVKNRSIPNFKKLSMNNSQDNYIFNVSSRSRGDYFIVKVKEDVYPEGFFELRKKVKFGKPVNATEKETDEFTSQWEEVRDAFLTQENWDLFKDIEEPQEDFTSGIIFIGILCTSIAIAIIWCLVIVVRNK